MNIQKSCFVVMLHQKYKIIEIPCIIKAGDNQ